MDGVVFNRTQPGEALTVPLEAGVLPCLAEGLRLMRVGSARRLICPPLRDFFHPRIKIGSTLIFDIELPAIVTAGGSSDERRTEARNNP